LIPVGIGGGGLNRKFGAAGILFSSACLMYFFAISASRACWIILGIGGGGLKSDVGTVELTLVAVAPLALAVAVEAVAR